MSWTPIFPLIIPFATGIFLLFGRDKKLWQHTVSTIGIIGMIISAGISISHVYKGGIQVFLLGNWPPPFNILLAVDMLGAIMTMVTGIVGLCVLLYSFADTSTTRQHGFYYALMFFLFFGINGAFSTGDLFNLFVFYEVMLMTSYVLLVLGNEPQQVKSGFTYLTLNLIGSTLFLAGAGILYAMLGTLNMAHIAQAINNAPDKTLITFLAMLFLCVFGLKSAIFPIYNWLPTAYTAPPPAVSAIFAGLLTKVGVYSMFRAFGTIFAHDVTFIHHGLLIPIAALTMLFGVWGAVVQYNVNSILAFHSISQVGYILMGLAVYAPLALVGGIYHMIHHSLIKSSLFLIGGGMERSGGSQNLKKLGGLIHAAIPLSIFFIISSMALAGIPPLSGFFSKFALVVSALSEKHALLVAAALLTSLFTLYSMIKIWRLGFWGEKSEDAGKYRPTPFRIMIGCAASVIFVLALSIFTQPVIKLCTVASNQLLDRDGYIKTVLAAHPTPQVHRSLHLAEVTQ